MLHRLSDLRAVGSEGSEQVSLAEGLLGDSETRVVYAQSPGEIARAGEQLGLTETEAELVTQLRRGMALWKVGRRSFLVDHQLGSGEYWMTDTDQAMADPGDGGSGPDDGGSGPDDGGSGPDTERLPSSEASEWSRVDLSTVGMERADPPAAGNADAGQDFGCTAERPECLRGVCGDAAGSTGTSAW